MADDLLSISNPIDTNEQVSISPPVDTVLPETAADRAAKASFGLQGKVDKTYDDYYGYMIGGKEHDIRSEAATTLDSIQAQKIQETITNYQSNNGTATESQKEYLRQQVIRNSKFNDPNSVFEDNYAKEYFNYLYSTPSNPEAGGWFRDAQREIPLHVQSTIDTGSSFLANSEYWRTQYENAYDAVQQQGNIAWGLDQAKQFFQAYNEFKLRQGPSFWQGIGIGSNMEATREALYRLPPDQMKAKGKEIMDKLISDNPSMAVIFAHSMLGQSTSEKAFNDVMSLLVPTELSGAAKALFGMTKGAVGSMLKSAKNLEHQGIKTVAADAAGDLTEAAVQKSSTELSALQQGHVNPVKAEVEPLFTALRADEGAFTANPGRFGQEIVNRLTEDNSSVMADVKKVIEQGPKVQRVLMNEEMMRAGLQQIRDRFTGPSSMILDQSPLEYDRATRSWSSNLHLGTANGEYFDSVESAVNTVAGHYGFTGGTIEPVGKGFAVSIPKTVDLTGDGLRNTILGTEQSRYINPYWSTKFAKWLTPNENLSLFETANRTAAVYGPYAIKDILSKNAQVYNEARSAIKNLGRNKNFQAVLDYSQTAMNPKTGKPGKFFNIPELEDHYYRNYGYFPTQTEIRGYAAWQRSIEIERVFANMNELSKMANMGAEQHMVYYTGPDGKRLSSYPFVAISHKAVPDGNGAVLILGESEGQHQVQNLTYLKGKGGTAKNLKEGIEQGTYRLLQVWNPDFKPLKGFGGVGEQPIRWVVTKNALNFPLAWEQIPRTEGGHLTYEYKRWVKQPIINTYKIGNKTFTEYAGDRTLFALDDKASGKQWTQGLNDFRNAYKSGNMDAARKVADQFPGGFKEFEQNVKKGFLNLDEEVHIVPKNTRIIEMNNSIQSKYGEELLDGSKHGSSPARSLTNPYTYEKDVHDLHVLGEEGSTANPAFTYRPARPLDATEAMNRGLSRIINSAFMDDYKLSSIEHWFQQAKPYMSVDKFNDLMRHPAYHFYKDELDNLPWLKDAKNLGQIEQLEAARIQIKAFNGIPSGLDSWLDKTSAQMEASIHGESKIKNTMNRAGVAGITSAKAVGDFIRKATYHSVLGLFTPTQFFVQQMSYFNIYAIAGARAAGKGSYAALATQWSRLNPSALEHLGKLGEAFGWRPGQLKEAYEYGHSSGFFAVGGEHSFTGYEYATPKITENAAGRFLDAGQFGFKEGERSVRYGAWYTAWDETVKPGTKITPSVLNDVLARADLLAGNMTKASRSGVQAGLLSYPTQFAGYGIRTAELIMGKRLTGAERIRLGAVNMAMYGIPASVGITGLPFGDKIREYAVKNGYVEGTNPFMEGLMEGLPHMFIHYLTGERVNFGQRYGYGGINAINEALLGDKPFWQWIGGASGALAISAVQSLHPFWRWAQAAVSGDQAVYPLRVEDFTNPLKQISSVNIATREYEALNSGRWLSRNNTYIGDVSPISSLALSATGLQPQAQVQANTLYNLTNKQSEQQKEGTKQALRQLNRFFDSIKIYDDNNANDYMKRAFSELIRAGVPEEDWGNVFKQASEAYGKTLIQRLDWQWYMQHVPSSDFKSRVDTYQQKLQTQGQ